MGLVFSFNSVPICYHGCRYYGGNEFIDQIEILCQERCLQAYGLNSSEWGVNGKTIRHYYVLQPVSKY